MSEFEPPNFSLIQKKNDAVIFPVSNFAGQDLDAKIETGFGLGKILRSRTSRDVGQGR